MKLRIFDTKAGIRKLGPGLRYGIWTQGCPRSCPGCMTPASQSLDGGYEVETSDLAREIRDSGLTELTISGGEPFIQAEALSEMVDMLRQSCDIGLIIYTGFTYEELACGSAAQKKLLSLCDLIIDGPYIDALNDGKKLRGSSNQRAVLLSERYREFIREFGAGPAEVEFFMSEEGLTMVGVPSREMLERIKSMTF